MALDMLSESPRERPTDPTGDMRVRLNRLSAKEREVLDQILLHKPLKIIAHDLGITLSAVDQRLKSARGKLGAADRHEAARAYSALLLACRESTCGFEAVGENYESQLIQTSEPPPGSTFMLQDSGTIIVPPSLYESGHHDAVSEILDEKFGRLWRIVAIPVLAVVIAMLVLAILAMARTLGELL